MSIHFLMYICRTNKDFINKMEKQNEPTINVGRDQIKETDAFKKLSKIQQDVTLNRVNVNHIQNGVNVLKNVGLEKWESQTSFSFNNQQIIKELFNKL